MDNKLQTKRPSLIINTLKVAIWVSFMLLFLVVVTGARDNRYSLRPDWLNTDGHISACDSSDQITSGVLTSCAEVPIGHATYGFPIQVPNHSSRAKLGWAFNFGVAAIVGIGFGYLLFRKPKIAFVMSGIAAVFAIGHLFFYLW